MSQLIVDKLQINSQLSIPQYSVAQRNSLSGVVTGTLIYLNDGDDSGLQVWDGSDWIGLAGGAGLYDFINVTFNNGGKTGAEGPTIAQGRSSMAGQGVGIWNTNTLYYNVDSNGVQSWTVPKTGVYRFLIAGAKGGEGNAISNNSGRTAGRGAVMRGEWQLEEGEVYNVIAGVKPNTSGEGGGGGGGSFVWSAITGEPLIVAGGGGGNGDVYYGTISQSAGDDGNASGTEGTEPNSGGGSLRGQNGNGGTVNNTDGGPGAGGGFLTGGSSGSSGAGGGAAATSGGKGGQADGSSLTSNSGGHGGGGGESFNGNDAEGAGGGGGYSGGGASGSGDPGGGGGGSFLADSGSNYGTSNGSWSPSGSEPHTAYTGSVDNLSQYNTGQGYVIVTFVS
jgi:hypothetical protein